MTKPVELVVERLRDRGYNPVRNGAGWKSRCPAHPDSVASLSVTEGDDARVLIHCHAGCENKDIVVKLDLTMADLFADKKTKTKRSTNTSSKRIVATYDYTDEDGELLFQAVRFEPKSFAYRRRKGSEWEWKLGDTRRVLYHLPEVRAAVERGDTIYVVEGEKDADRLVREEVVATTSPMGAGSWRGEYAEQLSGAARVVVVADRDEKGRAHAKQVAESLQGHVGEVVVMEPIAGKDASDHLDAGHTIDDLVSGVLESDATVQPLPRVPREPPAIAYSEKILDDFKQEVGLRGVVGEEATAATTYLVLTSRLLDKPVSEAVKGSSSTGKSFTVQTTVAFFPPEAVIEMTGMSERALVYLEEEFKHRTIILYEAEALRENANDDNQTAYLARSLLSEGCIKYLVTVKGPNGFVTKTIRREGPTNMIFTTTRTRVHYENETRVLSLTTDDSKAQTQNILIELANEDRGSCDLAEWHELQRWLQGAERRVTIPFGRRLAELVPPVAVRLRRDFGAVLSLIRAHAVLHQLTRPRDDRGRIIATIEDYMAVRDLVADVISQGVGASVSNAVRDAVNAVADLAIAHPDGVTAKALAEKLGIDKSAGTRRLRAAADNDYVRNLEDRKGHPGRWVLGEPLPETVEVLPSPDKLGATAEPQAAQREAGTGCAVAPEPERKEPEPVIASAADDLAARTDAYDPAEDPNADPLHFSDREQGIGRYGGDPKRFTR